MGIWDGFDAWKRDRDAKKDEEEEKKKDRARDSLSFWEKYEYDKLTGYEEKFPAPEAAAPEPEEDEKSSLIDRLAARGITVEMPQKKAQAAQTDTRPTLAGSLGTGADPTRLFTGKLRAGMVEENRQDALNKLADEAYRNQTVRDPEWMASLRTPEEIQADIDKENGKDKSFWQGLREDFGRLFGGGDRTENSRYEDFTTGAKAERIKALEDELAERRWADYEKLRDNADFDEKSRYKSTATGKEVKVGLTGIDGRGAFTDPLYDYINGNEDARWVLEQTKKIGGRQNKQYESHIAENVSEYTQYANLTEDEKKLYNYIHATEGEEEANEYLVYLMSDLYARQAEKEKAEAAAYAGENALQAGLASAGTVFNTPLRGAAFLGQAVDYLTTGKIDENAPYNRASYLPSAVRERVSKDIERNWGAAGSFFYNTGLSMLDFLWTSAASGGSEALSLALMGTGAAADATIAAKERGLDDTEAFIIGTIAGGAEIFSEKISVEKLFKNADWKAAPVKYILENIFFEGAEEVESDIINWTADAIVARDKSEWMADIRAYQKEHPGASDTEAFWSALIKRAKEGGLDFLGGALSGGVMASAGVGASRIAGVAQRSADRSADIEAARAATQAVKALGNKEAAQPQAEPAGIVLPTGEEAAEAELENAPEDGGENGDTLRFGTEPEAKTLTPTAEEAEIDDAVEKAAAEGNMTRATGVRYGVEEKTIRTMERLGEMTGHRVIFYEGQPRRGAVENGFTQKSTGDIYINVKAERPMQFVFAHEFTHNLEGTDAYRELMEHAKTRADESGMDWLGKRGDMRPLYERGTGETVTDEYIDEEILADWIGENLSDEKTIREICRETPSAAKRIRDALDGFIIRAANLGGVISPYEVNKYRNVVGLIDKYIGEANSSIEENARAAEEAPVPEAAPASVEAAAEGAGETGGERGLTADELYARAEELLAAGEIDEDAYEEMTSLAAEMESTGQDLSRSTVESEEGQRGKGGELAERARGRYSLSPAEVEQRDEEYMRMVEEGDTEEQQRMVDRAAIENRYTYRRNTRSVLSPVQPGSVPYTMFVKGDYLWWGENVGFNHDQLGYGDNEYVATDEGALDTVDIFEDLQNLAEEFYGERINDDEIDPPDIVDSAGIWDDPEFVQYMWDNYFEEIWSRTGVVPSVRTSDGLIFLNGEDSTDRIKSLAPITYDDEGNVIPLSERFNPEENDIRYSLVKDPDTLEFLNNQDTVKVYRAMQLIDGELYPPMAAKVEGKFVEPTRIGEWYQAEERPDLVKNGKFTLNKGNGTSIPAAYNPYFHSSASPLNDQFSSAYKRPNLVVVEGEIPSSELTSGYRAEGAKDTVGETKWHAGPVASKLKGDKARRVYLSRWFKADRVMSDAEVADIVADTLRGEDVSIPSRVVTPSLLEALRERGVPIIDQDPDIRHSVSEEDEETRKHRYDYDTLVNKESMRVVPMKVEQIPTSGKKLDLPAMATAGRRNASVIAKGGYKQRYVYIPDIGENVLITTTGVKHGNTGNKTNSSTMDTAQVTYYLPEILRNSVAVNEIDPRSEKDGEYSLILFGYAEDEHGQGYLVKSTLNHFGKNRSVIDDVEVYNVLKGIRGKKIDTEVIGDLSNQGDGLTRNSSASTISVSYLLDIVKRIHPEFLSEDVRNHLDVADSRREDGLRYSLSPAEEGDFAGMSQKAKAAALRIERQFTNDVLQAIQRNLNPNGAEFRQFRADVARPVIESLLRGEEADVDAVLESTGIDILGRADARGAVKDALRKARGEIGRIGEAMRESRQRKEAREARNAEIDAMIPDTAEGLYEIANKRKDAKKRWNALKARSIMTEEDLALAHRIATGQISEAEAFAENPFGMDEIVNMAQAEREFLEADAPWARYTKRLEQRRNEEADKVLENADQAEDKGNGFAYAREKPERNVRDVFGPYAEALIDKYIWPIHESEAASVKFQDEYNERVDNLDIDQKVRRGNAVSESAAVQFLGEALDNVRVLESARGYNAVRDGKTLEEWRAEIEAFRNANPNLDYDKVNRGIEAFRQMYKELIDEMNRVLVENGYEPVNVRRGYFPHFNGGNDGILATFANLLGISIDTNALPTSINGLTSMFKPGKPWFGHAMERTGFATDYDALQGFVGYLKGVSDVIHQTPNIRNLRALATRIRYRFGDEQIRKRIDAIEADDTRTEQEKLAAIHDLTENGKYKLSRFVSWLDEYTNQLANKKSKYDRGIEDLMGRRFYNWMKNIEGRVAANMIAGNLGSALTNFIPLNQAASELGDRWIVDAAFDTMTKRAAGDDFVSRSVFLTNRKGVDPLIQGKAEKISDWLSKPMNIIDDFTSETIVRAAYNKYRKEGLDIQSAMRAADEYASDVMADRSKGALPTIFGSHNPLTKLFTLFQVEVNNEFSHIFKDIPRRMYRDDKDKKRIVAATAWLFLSYFIRAYLFNDVFEHFVGRRAALDPIDILNDAVGDVTGKKMNNLWDALVGGEGFIEDVETANPSDALTDFGTNVLEELPFVGGLLGGGRIPISSALPDTQTIVKGLANENWSASKKAQTVGRELGKTVGTYILPPFAGGAGKKLFQTAVNTASGGRFVKDAEGNDQLQYPYFTDTPSETAGTVLQSLLFGPTATEGGRDWVEGGFGNQSAKNTALYRELTEDLGESQRASWDFLNSLKQQDALGKRMAVAESGLSEEGKAAAMEAVTSESEGRKFRAASEEGITADVWAALYEAMGDYDANGNKQYSQAEIRDALENITVPVSYGEGAVQGLFGGSTQERHLTNAEKAALWSAYNPTWKPANNPYDPTIGERIANRVNELKGGDE